MTRIGVFGSAFNPPTIGHLILVEEALWQLGLDRVVVMPTGEPYHKDQTGIPGAGIRLALARAAFRDVAGAEVSDLEVTRDGPSFTTDTLEVLTTDNPESDFSVLLGADAALKVGGWHRPGRLFELAKVAVASRERADRERIGTALEQAGGGGRIRFFEMPEIGISSSLVRCRIAAREPWQHLVPTAVARMIEDTGLYAA